MAEVTAEKSDRADRADNTHKMHQTDEAVARGRHGKGVVMVTGGSRGIGAATARLAAAHGNAVCVNFTSDR